MQARYVLLDGNSHIRYSVADALEVLCGKTGFSSGDHVTIAIGSLQPSDGVVVGLPRLDFRAANDCIYVVTLPAAMQFWGKERGAVGTQKYDIFELARATVEFSGRVHLKDGRVMSAVEVIPCLKRTEPTENEWKVLRAALGAFGGDGPYYRQLDAHLPGGPIPDLRRLDCSLLHELDLPLLKVVVGKLQKFDPSLKAISSQKIADALAFFGVRIPKRQKSTG